MHFVGPGDPIVLPEGVDRVDHEAELALVIGEVLRDADPERAMRAVFAVTALNDVTARTLQRRDGQWTRAKGFDTFCPVGPRLVSGLSTESLRVEARVNGETRQEGKHARSSLPLRRVDLVHLPGS